VDVDEKDYHSTIIWSLPPHLANFALTQLAVARLYATSKTIEPDVLISLISEETEWQKMKHTSRSDMKDRDEAMAVTSSSRSRGHGSSRGTQSKRLCWNCGSDQHLAAKCDKPPKEGEKKSTYLDSAHAVMDDTASEDRVFGVFETDDSDSLPNLISMESDSDDDKNAPSRVQGLSNDDDNWFSVTGDDSPWGCGWDNEELQAHEAEDETSSGCADPSPTAERDLENTAMEVSDHQEDTCCIELYDSGTTRHITPDRDHMLNVRSIPPKSFTAANQQKFSTTGVGDLIIEIPNGAEISKLCLTEMLYSPEVGYMLVSIGRLDELGLSTMFADGYCTIRDVNGKTIRCIPRSMKGLYHVVHEGEHAAAAMERLTVMEFHRRMGHIVPSVVQRLAEQGLVSGLKIDTSKDEPTFCESCIYGKATRKPIAKEREGLCAESIGDIVFSDVWGPAPVATLGGKRYYVTFTDDNTRLTHFQPLHQKSETFEAYRAFEDRQLAAKVKLLHSD